MYFMRFLLFHFKRNIKLVRREQKEASSLVSGRDQWDMLQRPQNTAEVQGTLLRDSPSTSCNWWLYVARLPDCELEKEHFIHVSSLSLKRFWKSHLLWLKFWKYLKNKATVTSGPSISPQTIRNFPLKLIYFLELTPLRRTGESGQ